MKVENTVEMLVDKVGAMKKIVADYNREIKALEEEIKDQCQKNDIKKVYGSVFNATYVEANRRVLDWKTLIDDMGVDSNTREKYTTTSAIFSLRIGV
jgi:hypothetical protein